MALKVVSIILYDFASWVNLHAFFVVFCFFTKLKVQKYHQSVKQFCDPDAARDFVDPQSCPVYSVGQDQIFCKTLKDRSYTLGANMKLKKKITQPPLKKWMKI